MNIKTLLIVSVIFIFAAGCSLEKRSYRKGYHVSWKKNHPVTAHIPEKDKKQEITPDKEEAVAVIPAFRAASEEAKVTATPVRTSKIAVAGTPLITLQPALSGTVIAQNHSLLESMNEPATESNRQQPDSDTEDSKGLLILLIGVILVLVGLPPFGVLVVKGSGRAFWGNLMIWITALLFILIGTVAFSATSFAGVFFWILGGIFALYSILHALIMILIWKK